MICRMMFSKIKRLLLGFLRNRYVELLKVMLKPGYRSLKKNVFRVKEIIGMLSLRLVFFALPAKMHLISFTWLFDEWINVLSNVSSAVLTVKETAKTLWHCLFKVIHVAYLLSFAGTLCCWDVFYFNSEKQLIWVTKEDFKNPETNSD